MKFIHKHVSLNGNAINNFVFNMNIEPANTCYSVFRTCLHKIDFISSHLLEKNVVGKDEILNE